MCVSKEVLRQHLAPAGAGAARCPLDLRRERCAPPIRIAPLAAARVRIAIGKLHRAPRTPTPPDRSPRARRLRRVPRRDHVGTQRTSPASSCMQLQVRVGPGGHADGQGEGITEQTPVEARRDDDQRLLPETALERAQVTRAAAAGVQRPVVPGAEQLRVASAAVASSFQGEQRRLQRPSSSCAARAHGGRLGLLKLMRAPGDAVRSRPVGGCPDRPGRNPELVALIDVQRTPGAVSLQASCVSEFSSPKCHVTAEANCCKSCTGTGCCPARARARHARTPRVLPRGRRRSRSSWCAPWPRAPP